MSLIFKYCPFCGGHIPENVMVKYCPFCGEKFIISEHISKAAHFETPIVVEDKVEVQLPPLHDERSEINIDEYKRKKMGKIIESEYYSIILKNAPNKSALVQKLEKVLARGSFAIRLAIDTIPSIIVYKAKSEDIIYLNEAFIAEQASTSIVAGDFNNKPAIEEIFTMFDTLHIHIQKIIKQLPINLWIGDHIQGVFPNTYRDENKGITIIADKNIYFVPNESDMSPYPWFVRSYHLLSKVIMEDDCLLLGYKNNIVTSISFVNKERLSEAYQCISHAIEI